MKPCCGNCAHHHEGAAHLAKGYLGKGKNRQEYTWETREYAGGHPNGKCCAAGGTFRGVVTGFYGHCDKHLMRGALPVPPPNPFQADVEDFA